MNKEVGLHKTNLNFEASVVHLTLQLGYSVILTLRHLETGWNLNEELPNFSENEDRTTRRSKQVGNLR